MLLQRKKIKLDFRATLGCQPSETHASHPSPPSLAAPERSRKRKSPHDSQVNPSEGSEAKRLKETAKNSGKYLRDTSVELWPGIDDDPLEEEDEVNTSLQRLYRNSYRTAMARIQQLENQSEEQYPRRRGGPLPSPTPSDGGAGESRPTSINRTQTSHTTLEPLEPQTMPACYTMSLEIETDNRPSHQRFRKRRPRRQSRHNQGHARDQTSSAAVKDLLQSKRASRRDVGCALWHLDDKGTARLV